MYKGVQNNIIIHQPDLLRKIRNTSITLQKTVSFSYLCVMKKILTDTQYIHQLVAEGEHEHQDFKFEISDARKIARSISAFANTGGGRLLVGVKDNGKIAGIRSEEEIYMIEAAANMYCQPKVEIETKTYIAEGRTVLEIDIDEATAKPICALDEENKPKAYIRIADENILATPVHLKIWQHHKRKEGALITFTGPEKLLLEELANKGMMTLNQCQKTCRLTRNSTCNLLAKFIRFELITLILEGHKFYFQLNEE